MIRIDKILDLENKKNPKRAISETVQLRLGFETTVF